MGERRGNDSIVKREAVPLTSVYSQHHQGHGHHHSFTVEHEGVPHSHHQFKWELEKEGGELTETSRAPVYATHRVQEQFHKPCSAVELRVDALCHLWVGQQGMDDAIALCSLTKCLSNRGMNRLRICWWKSQQVRSLGSPGINIPCIANFGSPMSMTIPQNAS